jgi:hypothetical protein
VTLLYGEEYGENACEYIQGTSEMPAGQLLRMVGHKRPSTQQGAAQILLGPSSYPTLEVSDNIRSQKFKGSP